MESDIDVTELLDNLDRHLTFPFSFVVVIEDMKVEEMGFRSGMVEVDIGRLVSNCIRLGMHSMPNYFGLDAEGKGLIDAEEKDLSNVLGVALDRLLSGCVSVRYSRWVRYEVRERGSYYIPVDKYLELVIRLV